MESKLVHILYADIRPFLINNSFLAYLSGLPDFMQKDINRKINIKDRKISTAGKLLLSKGLSILGLDKYTDLKKIKLDTNNRPYLSEAPDFVDFNITHTDYLVAGAFSQNVKLGIDIEFKNRAINISNFKRLFTPSQWEDLEQNPDFINQFYQYWSQKEAVAKADGRGLSFPFHEIEINSNRAVVGKNNWHLKQLEIENETHSSWLASSDEVNIQLHKVWLV